MEPIVSRGRRNRWGKSIGGSRRQEKGSELAVGFGGDGVSPLFIMASLARLLRQSPSSYDCIACTAPFPTLFLSNINKMELLQSYCNIIFLDIRNIIELLLKYEFDWVIKTTVRSRLHYPS